MKSASNELNSKLDVAEERTSELDNIIIETLKWKVKIKKDWKKKKNQNRLPRIVGQHQKA